MDVYISTMRIRQTYGSSVVVVLVALAIILPLLAYLQYTWLGQIHEQEYERMKDNLQTTAFHCSMDFSSEITDIMKSLGATLAGSDDQVQNTLHARISKWKALSADSAVVSLETRICSLPLPEDAIRVMVNDEVSLFLFKDLSAIALPIHNRSRQAVLITLNREIISSAMLPRILQTNFPSSTRSEYDIVISNERGLLLYHSGGRTNQDIFKTTDLVVPFFIIPPSPPASAPAQWLDRNQFGSSRDLRPGLFERGLREFDRRAPPPPPREAMSRLEPNRSFRERGLFEMRLTYRNGSLEAAVKNNQLRNLALSFGTLLLLGASIVFLLLSTQRARRLAEQQLEFVAGISHELRTPLAVLKSAGENLADGVIQEKDRTRKYGELIKNEVVRLSGMVEKALAYAGIQSGKQMYDLHSLNVTDVIQEAVRNLKKLIPSNGGTILIEIDKNLPRVRGDAAALQSALENLMMNGLKYSAEKKWLRVEAHASKESKESVVEINIEDHGIGIAASDIANIFKPFYRGRNAIEGQIHGSGLGLSIAKHIIESHGGTISVKCSSKEGSVFTILLPSYRGHEEIT
jgi:two-component system, OmpR family, sensor histidine kinase SenX3